MKITVYTMCYNEESILPFFLNHYSKFATEIIIYDNESTDNTVSIASKHPLVSDIKTIKTDNSIDDRILSNFKNTCWKDCISDFAIVVDVDELLYHPDIINFLSNNYNYSMFKPFGYNMISTSFPQPNKNITSQIKMGVRDILFDKQCLFKPKELIDINYDHGAHVCKPEFKSNNSETYFSSDLKLLHYKYLGLQYILDKNKRCSDRLSQFNLISGCGAQYTYPIEEQCNDFHNKKNAAHLII